MAASPFPRKPWEPFFEFLLILATPAPPPGTGHRGQDLRTLHLADGAYTALQLKTPVPKWGQAHGGVGNPLSLTGLSPPSAAGAPISVLSGEATGPRAAGLAPPRPLPSSLHYSSTTIPLFQG